MYISYIHICISNRLCKGRIHHAINKGTQETLSSFVNTKLGKWKILGAMSQYFNIF